jgi:two-component system, NtrC family, response regulator AtoC
MEILIIDDEKDACNLLSNFILKMNHNVNAAYDGRDGLEKIKANHFDLIISDVNMPFYSGIEIVKKLKDLNFQCEIILISGIEEVIESINALDLGILDFLTKPLNLKKLVLLINSVNENLKKKIPSEKLTFDGISTLNLNEYRLDKKYSIQNEAMGEVGIFSEKMYSIYKKLKKLEEYNQIPVLIEGETGTGKEIIAKYIHYENPLNKGPFIGLNCSNLSKELFESELFGYEKGSFTGADVKGKEGKIKLAQNGTLFLDEVTELTLDLQAKLLRVIQEREYFKIGGNKKEILNARIVVSSNKNIQDLINEKLFREDLYYRLNICKVTIPPLRERNDEIIPLSIFLLQSLIKELGKKIDTIETSALEELKTCIWQGNVRELKNFLTKILLFNDSNTISLDTIKSMLSADISKKEDIKFDLTNFTIPEKPFNLEEFNHEIIKKTLEKFKGNKSKTAQFLGLNRIQMYGRFKDHLS